MKRGIRLFVLVPAVALVAAGCGGELSTREKGTLGGAGLGAATGAIIGAAVGHPGAGAAIGAGMGALGGAMVGGSMQESERKAEAGRQTPPPPYSGSAPPPPPPVAKVTQPVDPTRGQLENATKWRLKVFVDQDPNRLDNAPYVTLSPGDVVPQNLDLGTHRIIAQAFVETSFGTRTVGRYDRSIQIDPKGSGWNLRLAEGDFR